MRHSKERILPDKPSRRKLQTPPGPSSAICNVEHNDFSYPQKFYDLQKMSILLRPVEYGNLAPFSVDGNACPPNCDFCFYRSRVRYLSRPKNFAKLSIVRKALENRLRI